MVGATGATGPQGPAGTVGPEGIRWLGAWASGTAYLEDDAVSHDGDSYIAVAGNTNDPPPSANWSLMAAEGAPGPTGPGGAVGATGPTGPA